MPGNKRNKKEFKFRNHIKRSCSLAPGTHSSSECPCAPSSSSLLMLMTLTAGLASSAMTMAGLFWPCDGGSSSQSCPAVQQSSSTRPLSCSSLAICPSSGHLASSSSTPCTFFAVSAIFGDWHAKFWTFVVWEKLLPLFVGRATKPLAFAHVHWRHMRREFGQCTCSHKAWFSYWQLAVATPRVRCLC